MMILDVVMFSSGTPQFRIQETADEHAPKYIYYGQQEMEEDLIGIYDTSYKFKVVHTFDNVSTLKKGDVLFSLISGRATQVQEKHEGYLYTQNYVKLVCDSRIDSKYLVFVLNEDTSIKKQLQLSMQGSSVLKCTLQQLKELQLPTVVDLEKQMILGKLYYNQLRLQALKTRVAQLETNIRMKQMKEVVCV